jgi:hypothetical protein
LFQSVASFQEPGGWALKLLSKVVFFLMIVSKLLNQLRGGVIKPEYTRNGYIKKAVGAPVGP